VNSSKIIVLVVSVLALLTLILSTGCPAPSASPTPTPSQGTPTPSQGTPTPSQGTPTPSQGTPTPSTPTGTELSYNVLSPRGIALPVKIQPLAARLKLPLDGKTIFIVQGEADPIIMPALNDYARQKLPNVTWNYYNPSSGFGGTSPDATTKAAANGLIRGVGW